MTLAGPTATRADRLEQRLAERELDALLVTNLVNVRYLTGFTGTNAVALVGPEVRLFATDFRYVEQAAEQVPDFERVRGRLDLLEDAAKRMSGRIGFDDSHMTVRQHRRLRELIPDGVELVAAGGAVEEVRAVKDAGEIELIRAAAKLMDGVYEHIAARGLVGRTEREVALDIEREARERGAEGLSFPSIVAGGGHGALPHAEPRDVRIEADTLVVVDTGCVLDGYCSDATRTFATGTLSGEARAVYDLVLEAQIASLGAVRAGVSGKAVDTVARDLIAAAGHGDRFGHGLGHGVGLEIHEAPRLSQSADDSPLVAGNVVTVEPGVYLPGKLGVRIEDLVVVTEDGSENLTGYTKELVTVD
ncbi:MAG: Xaa-Pro aminopeptidase [Thermoleophilaceae bacterium]|nr:Xaa-Pro aminopeptidase [Thermoleophilaceae bacterium]